MFNCTILALKGATPRLPSSTLLSALLLITAAPVTQAASADVSAKNMNTTTSLTTTITTTITTRAVNNKASSNWATQPISPAAYCDSYIKGQAQTTALSPSQNSPSSQKNQNSQRRTMDCMLTQLHVYQQQDKSARQQYLAYKAQAWLNYAYYEEGINGGTAAGSNALQSANTILQALQNDTAEQLSITTDIPTTSALMRPDLWATLNALKDSNGIKAAPREVAFSEVALIWGATEQCARGERQSGTHFRMADRWLEQAREAYVNIHDSATNVALEELINRYFKQYAPLDTGDDVCSGPVLPSSMRKSSNSQKISSTQILPTEVKRDLTVAQTIPMPIPTVTYRIVY